LNSKFSTSPSASSNLPDVVMFAGSTMIAPADFRAAIASSMMRSTAALKPKKLRATPMRTPLRAAGFSTFAYDAAALPRLAAVAGSRGSGPLSAASSSAASATVRAIGPAVSWLCEMGMMPERLTRPTVGLIPTSPFADDGHTIDPSVSVPMPTAARLAEIDAPVPELDPHGFRSST
jgi:hypothetical protein